MNFKIEEDIKMPNTRSNSKYPFADLDVGHSFQMDGNNDQINALRTSACYYGSRNEKKFSVIKNDTGARCWRVK